MLNFAKNPATEFNAVKMLSPPAYYSAQKKIMPHAALHLFAHNIFCRFSSTWVHIPYTVFRKHAIRVSEGNVGCDGEFPNGTQQSSP